MSWKPPSFNKPWNRSYLRGQGTLPPGPASGVEQSQGSPYLDPSIADYLQVPQDMELNLDGWVNPYSLTFYQFPLDTTDPTRVLPPNFRRAYLIIQNQGPGNVFLNFGQDATAATSTANSNAMQLIQTQIYEQIGGGGVNWVTGFPVSACFVSPDYVSCIADQPNTTVLVGEGIWRFIQPQRSSNSIVD